jgi:Protein of unknown function (DUF2934)
MPKKAAAANSQLAETENHAALVAVTAYYKAEARGFESGHEIEDWLAAEQEVDALLSGRTKPKKTTRDAKAPAKRKKNIIGKDSK